MITYELAKQLKNTGFQYQWLSDKDMVNASKDWFPTLSELIEACGEEFEELGHLRERGEFNWYVTKYSGEGERFYGSTPEIAVAKLWLELQK